jgi:hypothetical protein
MTDAEHRQLQAYLRRSEAGVLVALSASDPRLSCARFAPVMLNGSVSQCVSRDASAIDRFSSQEALPVKHPVLASVMLNGSKNQRSKRTQRSPAANGLDRCQRSEASPCGDVSTHGDASLTLGAT